jgi:Nucleotidyltransferase domain
MTIPESQLSTWSNYQQPQSAVITHESIRSALTDSNSSLSQQGLILGKDYEIYLQGSYRNSTNIRADSDVDVVVQFLRNFHINKLELPLEELELFNLYHSPGTFTYQQFRSDVLKSLESYYGKNVVESSDKCIKLAKGSNRLSADIIPCIQYRHYDRFQTYGDMDNYVEGMTLWSQKDNRQVINYPKLHYQGSVNKHQATGANYKPIVRMFKNARNKAIERNLSSGKVAPSYFLECLLYNVPDRLFTSNLQISYTSIVSHILHNINQSYVCQNERVYLFGDTPEQWSMIDAIVLVSEFSKLRENW